jgi:hypothetical protein
MGAPFARSIDRHRAHHDLQTSHAASATSREGITLSDGQGHGERAPSRRYVRKSDQYCLSAEALRSVVLEFT